MTDERAKEVMATANELLAAGKLVVLGLASLLERAVVALERTAEAHERVATTLDNMYGGHIDVRIYRPED